MLSEMLVYNNPPCTDRSMTGIRREVDWQCGNAAIHQLSNSHFSPFVIAAPSASSNNHGFSPLVLEAIAVILQQTQAFWRIFAKYGIPVISTTYLVSLVATHLVERFGLRNAEQALRIKSSLVGRCAARFSVDRDAQIQAEVMALRTEIHSRITFLDAEGNVLADSDVDPARIANLAAQPELVAARRGEDLAIIRHSAAMDKPMIFSARRVDAAAPPVAFVRVADSLADVKSGVSGLKQSIWISFVGISLGVLLCLFLSRHPAAVGMFLAGPARSDAGEPTVRGSTASQGEPRARAGSVTLASLPADFLVHWTEEMRGPLASIKASSETLLFGALDDAVCRDQFLRQIDSAADQLHRLICDGLILADPAPAERELAWEAVPLEPLVVASLESHRARAEGQQLVLSAERGASAGDSPAGERSSTFAQRTAWADEEVLGQLLDCLIGAAMHWSPPGSRIQLGARAEQDRVCMRLTIAGAALGVDELPRLFEPFFRIDRGRMATLAVTGLELPIACLLARTLGGALAAECGPDKEMTLAVRLRRAG